MDDCVDDNYKSLVARSAEAIVLLGRQKKIVYANPTFCGLTGFSGDDCNEISNCLGDVLTGIDGADVFFERLLQSPGIPLVCKAKIAVKSGKSIWVEGHAVNLLDTESIKAIVFNFRDITSRVDFEEHIVNLNRVYAFISEANHIIVQVKEEEELFKEFCRIAMEHGRFKLAWIGLLKEETGDIVPLMSSGEEAGYLAVIGRLNIFDPVLGCGPTGRAIRNGVYCVCNDIYQDPMMMPWREQTSSRNFLSSIALPIRKSNKVIGCFTMYSDKVNFFTDEEIYLLERVASDISFALDVIDNEKQRALVEQKLVRSENSLKQAQAMAHLGNWELNLATGKTYWTDEARKIYGIKDPNENPSFNDWLSFLHPEDMDRIRGIISESRNNLSNTAFYSRIVSRTGLVRYIHTLSHYAFEDGQPTVLYGVVHDVTDLKASEEMIRHSEANLRQIVNLIPHSIFVRDYAGTYILVNNAYAGLFGLKPEELIGKNRVGLINFETQTEHLIDVDRDVVLQGKVTVLPEVVFVDYKGNKRYFTTIKAPFRPIGSETNAILSIANEITGQKLAEIERNNVLDDMIRRNKDLEQFSYITSHNLKSPIANILGLLDLMSFPDTSQDEKDFMLSELVKSVRKLEGVINDINICLRVKNVINEHKESVKLSLILDDIEQSIDMQMRSEQVQLHRELQFDGEIRTIKSYLYSILLNLITNSIKYRRKDVPPVINVKVIDLGDNIEIIHSDNGMGIDMEKNKDKVFGLYKRFHNHTEGKGMGLYMVKSQVEAIGGTIDLFSEVNVGTTFKIMLNKN